MSHPRPPLLARTGPNSWHTPRPAELAALLAARPDLHTWQPSTGRDARCANELLRAYHKDPAVRGRVPSSALVVSRNGYVRCSGEEPGRCAALLDAIAAAAQPATPSAEATAPIVEQGALW